MMTLEEVEYVAQLTSKYNKAIEIIDKLQKIAEDQQEKLMHFTELYEQRENSNKEFSEKILAISKESIDEFHKRIEADLPEMLRRYKELGFDDTDLSIIRQLKKVHNLSKVKIFSTGKPITRRAVEKRLEKMKERSGIDEKGYTKEVIDKIYECMKGNYFKV